MGGTFYEVKDNNFEMMLGSSEEAGVFVEKKLRTKIREMKNLAILKDKRLWRHTNLASNLFVQQGNYIKDIKDQYDKIVPYSSYKPSYSEMHEQQIRSYITWRTRLRCGEICKTSISYVVLYIFEVINNIGVVSAEDGFAKLAYLWSQYRDEDSRIDRYLVRWLKDYYLCNDFSQSFSELIRKHELQKFFPEISRTYENGYLSPEELRKISNYKLPEKSLWRGGALSFFDDCLSAVMKNMELLLDLYGLRLSDILACKISGRNFWSPFDNALYLDVPAQDKKIYINPVEFYECVNGVWSFYHPNEQNHATAAFVGYIVKRVEKQLEVLVNGGGDLPSRFNLQEFLRQVGDSGIVAGVNAAIGDEMFDEVIDSSVLTCYLAYDKKIKKISKVIPVSTALKIMEMAESEPYCRFREIRRLAMIEMKKKDESLQFFEQANALADIEDDFSEEIDTRNHITKAGIYTHMNNAQLRSYMTWRSTFRTGCVPARKDTWILQYMCELIHGVGESSSLEIISKLKDILWRYGCTSKRLKKLAVEAIRDFYLCNEFDFSFVELIRMMGLESFFPYVCIAEKVKTGIFQVYSGLSSYKILKSQFYSQEKSGVIDECFSHVLLQVEKFFATKGLDWHQVINGVPTERFSFRVFKSFDFYYETKKHYDDVSLCKGEVYTYTSGSWICSGVFQGNPAAPSIVGYIMKRMEAAMRNMYQYKNKLSPDVCSAVYNMADGSISANQVEEAMLDPEFDLTIDRAVYRFFEQEYPDILREKDAEIEQIIHTPVVVYIDESLLADIREKADENLEKLLIIEGEEMDEEIDSEISNHIAVGETTKKVQVETMPNAVSEWSAFAEALIEPARQALQIIIGKDRIDEQLFALSGQCNIMVEVLIEKINELALEYIGDMIIETDDKKVEMFEEYIDAANAILKT